MSKFGLELIICRIFGNDNDFCIFGKFSNLGRIHSIFESELFQARIVSDLVFSDLDNSLNNICSHDNR